MLVNADGGSAKPLCRMTLLKGKKRIMKITQQVILEGIGIILKDIIEAPVGEVGPEQTFADDLGIDSLTTMELALAAANKFGVEISVGQLWNVVSVQDFIDCVGTAGK
jgi:acyl carrier protein